MQLVDHRRLADPGIARHQHQLGSAAGDDAREGLDQHLDLMFTAIQLLGYQQAVGGALLVQAEGFDAPSPLPVVQAAAQVVLDAGGALVAILGGLGQQLEDDLREHRRHAGDPLAGRQRLARDVAVHPFHRVAGGEWQRAGEHLVEDHAKGIEVAARVDGAVHPSGLLRRHVGQGAGDGLRRLGRLALARQPRGQAEAGQACLAIGAVDLDVVGLEVLVHQATLVQVAQRHGDVHGQAQAGSGLQGLAQQA
ncbi:hypothetical protein D9M71_294220 [compost metagenome]